MPPVSVPLAVLLVVLGMAATQAGASLAKLLFPLVGPQGATVLRLGLAALVLALVLRPWRRPPPGRQWRAIGLYGLAMGAMNLLFYQALATIPLGIAVALEFTGPLGVALAGARRPADVLWVGLAVLGLWLLLPLGGTGEGLDPVGVGFALGAGACWAGYIVFGQRAGLAGGGAETAALGVATAALVALPFGAAPAWAGLLMPGVLPLAFGVALLSSAIPYALDMIALPRLPARTFGILMSAQPALAALSGLVLLAEGLEWRQWAGIGAVVLASLGASAGIREPRPPA